MVLLEDISALYTIDFCLHLPSSGQAVFILQLHFGSAVGGLSVFGKGGKKLFVMAQDDRGHIWHAANFNIVFVAYLVKRVMFREMLCN